MPKPDRAPLFCPNSDCPYFESPPAVNWLRKNGTFTTATRGTIQRFICLHCKRGFSESTFSLDYFAKRRVPYRDLLLSLVTKSGIRDMGRIFHLSPHTVSNRIERMARSALALDWSVKKNLIANEDFVADGFESFVSSQYFPDNFHFLVGKSSQFVYFFDHVILRRKGAMTETQKARRSALENEFRADKGATMDSFGRLLSSLYFFSGRERDAESARRAKCFLYSDQKIDYARSVSIHPEVQWMKRSGMFSHVRISSRKDRTVSNDLFSVNYLDREIRKSLASHVRETVQFTRNLWNGLSRMILFCVHHNYFKNYRIREEKTNPRSHAEVAGVPQKEVARLKTRLFTERPFFWKSSLPMVEKILWVKGHPSPGLNTRWYLPRYALA